MLSTEISNIASTTLFTFFKSASFNLRFIIMDSSIRKRYVATSNDFKDQKPILSSKDVVKRPVKMGQKSFFNAKLASFIMITILSIIGFALRVYKIGENNHVIWDEAHFAKFGSFYNKHTFYHDVHPPLGKMLCGLSEHIFGYDAYGNWDYTFDSGSTFPEGTNFFGMRLFQVIFSSLIVPMTGIIVQTLGFSLWTQTLVTLMVSLENSFIVLGKFVLLDSFLMFFSTAVLMCLCKVHSLRKQEGSISWIIWMVLLGVNIGCVCSVKWVGLFVTLVVGVYTIIDLWLQTWKVFKKKLDIIDYIASWISRILCLIILPSVLYLIFFKIHFELLYKPGDGSGSMNTLFQVNMPDTDMGPQPRWIQLNDHVTIRSQGPNGNLLHSHAQIYPKGSKQRQITVYGYKDTNNIWQIDLPRVQHGDESSDKLLRDGDRLRFNHVLTKGNLHSHMIPSHVDGSHWEVSGYGDETVGDLFDDWYIEVVEQIHSSNKTFAALHEKNSVNWQNSIHPITTTFKIRHAELGCYLATTGASYPAWGFSQGEVVCLDPKSSLLSFLDTSSLWNIESVENSTLDLEDGYVPPKSNFLKDFIQLQRSMAASNNALTPDESKHDSIASSWWQWPILSGGIRMSVWGNNDRKYYMFGNPFTFAITTILLPFVFVGYVFNTLLRWKRGILITSETNFWNIIMWVVLPVLGYVFHYLPFILMSRVTYFHHYMPALYFAIIMTGSYLEYLTSGSRLRPLVFLLLYAGVIVSFMIFYPTCLGMNSSPGNFSYMHWVPEWHMAVYLPISKCWPMLRDHLKSTASYLLTGGFFKEENFFA